MKFLPIFLVFVMCFAARGYSETIQCYECEDCGDITESLLQSCPKEATEATTASSTSTESTEAPVTTTDATESTSESTTESSTTEVSTEGQAPSGNAAAVKPEVVLLTNGIQQAISQNSRLNRSYRSILRAGPSYLCYSVDKIDGDSKKPQKGCVEVPEDQEACDVLKAQYGEIENCETCQESKCNNGSAALTYSIAMLMFTLVLGRFFK